MHNYSTPYAISILKNLLPSLKPGARVIINDHCLREPGQENPWDEKIMRRMDMTMLTLLNAQERTEAEFRDLFRQVDEGFVFKASPTPLPPSLLVKAEREAVVLMCAVANRVFCAPRGVG